MLDIKFIRENIDKIKENCEKRGVKVDIKSLLRVDEKRRKVLGKVEEINAQKNKASKEIPGLGSKEKKIIISEMQKLDKESDKMEKELKNLDQEFEELISQIPNLCFESVPSGKDECDNVVIRKVGKKPKFSFKQKDYLEIAENLDLIDIKRAAKVSGTRFGYLKKEAALLEIALINLAFEVLIKQGFIPVIPPVLIKPEMMKAMGYIDTKEDLEDKYFLKKDNLFLVGTSEQVIGPIHAQEVLEGLPKRYVSFSTCFRQEAGSYGKDTKGILRVHQFDKVEMFSFVKPEDSEKEHKYLLSLEEKLMKLLELPYRVVQLCSGDLAKPSAATYDIEAWIPSENKYRETHSTSNCTDFQARRLNIKHKGKKLEFVHTLNGTAFAIGRMLIAIIENHQQKDGSIKVPKALQKYTGFKVVK
jgi:seryl-tRNA synthetase